MSAEGGTPLPAPTTTPQSPGAQGSLIRWGRALLVVAVVVAAGYALVSNWREVSDTITHLHWYAWLPAFACLPVAILLSTLSWQILVDEIGEPIGVRRGAQIFLVGQLGKYLPGSVWAYVLQIELGRRAGLARARIFTATVFSLAVAVVAALLTGSLAIPTLAESEPSLSSLPWLYLLLPFGLIGLHPRVLTWAEGIAFKVLRRPRPDHPVRPRAVVASLAAAVGSYAFFGAHLWALVQDTGRLGVETLPLCIGTMATAMIAGLFFFLLPSGAGVRELVIVTALAPHIGTGAAIALAAVSRVFLTVADVLTAGLAALIAVLEQRRSGPYHGDPGVGDDES